MTKPPSVLYSVPLSGAKKRISEYISRGYDRSQGKPLVFFRADDVGVPSSSFHQLIEVFKKYNMPLCLAAVPLWTTRTRLSELRRLTGTKSSQWCWHQHGRLHRNFEKSGKNQEFGPARSREEIYHSLTKGRNRLEQLLENDFYPVFTPPWNRCSGLTLQALTDLNFHAVSRSRAAQPPSPSGLPDLQVGVDLHTRKELSPQVAFENLLAEIERELASGLCGIMIHHQRMNRAAFELLDLLLDIMNKDRRLVPVHFADILNNHANP